MKRKERAQLNAACSAERCSLKHDNYFFSIVMKTGKNGRFAEKHSKKNKEFLNACN